MKIAENYEQCTAEKIYCCPIITLTTLGKGQKNQENSLNKKDRKDM
jgi:hypothetical protein